MPEPETVAAGFRRRRRVLAGLALLSLAAACVDAGDVADAPAAPVAAAPAAAPATEPARAAESSGAPQVAALDTDPKQLVGMDRAGLAGLLGTPGFTRHDAPAELWQYRHKSCTLDLYLYSDTAGPADAPKVRHYDVRDRKGKNSISARKCLSALLKARPPGNQ